jgi:glycine/D-amino acid oxidase-like deaminating enzyme
VQERPYWLEGSPRPEALGHSELPHRTDVVVIGGGFTGLSAAWVLARAGAAVTVIDRGPLGSGASTRNAGFVLPGFRRDARSLVAHFGAVLARDLFDASREAVLALQRLATGDDAELPCDYRPSGHLIVADTAKHYEELERECEVLAKALRHETDLVPGAKLGAELGASVPYFGGRVDPLGASLNPAKLLWSLAGAARRAGVTLVEEVEVQSLQRAAGRFMVRTTNGTLGAKDVVVATGGYGHPVLPSLGRRIFTRGSTTITTAPLGQHVARTIMPRDRVVTDTRDLATWFRLTPDTRLVFGAEDPQRNTTRQERLRSLSEAMCANFPRLLGTDVDYHWVRSEAMTLDRLPHAGVKDSVHYALGCNGHGVALATYLGALVAEHICGDGDLEPFRSLRFRALPLNLGRRPWFLRMATRYYELRDSIRQ